MKKLLIAATVGLAATGAFAETEVYNLTFNVKQLVPSYTKDGKVDYMKQGSVKYTSLLVDGNAAGAWTSKEYLGNAFFALNNEVEFGKKDEKLAVDATFGNGEGAFFGCAGFGTEKSVSGSFVGNVEDGSPAYGTWSAKVNASVAKKLDANPDLTLPEVVSLPKDVKESFKDWEALQDAIDQQMKGATTLAELKTVAEAALEEAKAERLAVTNKIAEIEAEKKAAQDDLTAYTAKWGTMNAAITQPVAANYELTAAAKKKVDDAKTAFDAADAKVKAFEAELDVLKKSLEAVSANSALDWFPADGEVQKDGTLKTQNDLWKEAIEATNKLVVAKEANVTSQKDGAAVAKLNWEAEVAVTNGVWTYFADLAGKALSKDYTADLQYADATLAYNKSVKDQGDAIAAYDAPVKTEKILDKVETWGGIDNNGVFLINLGGALTEAKLYDTGYYPASVYEYNLDFYNRNGYWEAYELDGAAREVTDAENFVKEVEKAIKQVAAAVASEKEKMEQTLVEYLKNQYLK